jgi:hypothetical protein
MIQQGCQITCVLISVQYVWNLHGTTPIFGEVNECNRQVAVQNL